MTENNTKVYFSRTVGIPTLEDKIIPISEFEYQRLTEGFKREGCMMKKYCRIDNPVIDDEIVVHADRGYTATVFIREDGKGIEILYKAVSFNNESKDELSTLFMKSLSGKVSDIF